ncbi:2Fe-2S iron-sulfur cluster binding domain-containing protein [Duganella phyllosphaerae]|uniref:2Fe-2S iron-sulfur cluster binding domain-containing protein n=1 Tax=Duganella phyllosphaerae TaxID=762836 RepID=UPI000A0618D2
MAFRSRISPTDNLSIRRWQGEHGIDIPVSCEQGICSTCITRVLHHSVTIARDSQHLPG